SESGEESDGGRSPRGVVEWRTSGAGTFDPGTECTLVGGSCSVDYTPTGCDRPTITAEYTPSSESDEGDSTTSDEGSDSDGDDFAASSGSSDPLTVTGCGSHSGPGHFLPDNLIRRTHTTKWFGEGIIN